MQQTALTALRAGTFAAALAIGAGFVFAPSAADAALLSSGSELNGVGAVADLLPASGGSGTLASDATGIDFINNSLSALTASGDLAPMVGASGTIQDIPEGTLPESGGALFAVPNFYVYTIGANTVRFDLGTILSVMRDDTGLTALVVSGTGTLRATINGIVYDPTPATYELSTQGDGSTTFSASTVVGGAQEVPEPATLGRFGLGLLGMAGAARRRWQA
jgi:hypothetical protein